MIKMLYIPNRIGFDFDGRVYRFWTEKPLHLNFYRSSGIYRGIGDSKKVESQIEALSRDDLHNHPQIGKDNLDFKVIKEMQRIVNTLKYNNMNPFFAYAITGALADLVIPKTAEYDDTAFDDDGNDISSDRIIKPNATNFVFRKLEFSDPNPLLAYIHADGY